MLSMAPLLPRADGPNEDTAAHLALPPGLAAPEGPLDVLPTSVLEARVQFTLLSRELGLDYRRRRGVEEAAVMPSVAGLGTSDVTEDSSSARTRVPAALRASARSRNDK